MVVLWLILIRSSQKSTLSRPRTYFSRRAMCLVITILSSSALPIRLRILLLQMQDRTKMDSEVYSSRRFAAGETQHFPPLRMRCRPSASSSAQALVIRNSSPPTVFWIDHVWQVFDWCTCRPTCRVLKTRSCSGLPTWMVHAWEVID